MKLFSVATAATGLLVTVIAQILRRQSSGRAGTADQTADDSSSTPSCSTSQHCSTASMQQQLQQQQPTSAQDKTHDSSTVDQQQENRRLQGAYASMAAAFASNGLDLAAVAETAPWFEKGPCGTWPRRYSQFLPRPLPPGCVRLVVIPVAENCPRLASTAAAVAGNILSLLPAGCRVFSNARQNLHVTVFHFSHPVDTRPDALDPYSGLQHCISQQPAAAKAHPQQQQQHDEVKSQASQQQRHHQQHVYEVVADSHTKHQECLDETTAAAPAGRKLLPDPMLLPSPCERPGPSDMQLAAEQRASASVAAATSPFALQFERVLLARSGVLLITWTDPSGAVSKLRKQLHNTFPGACSKQSNIIHTSLFRIVETPPRAGARATWDEQLQQSSSSNCNVGGQLSEETVKVISAECEQWTHKLHGAMLPVSQMWWVSEEEFSSIQGQRLPLPCKKAAIASES